MDLKALATALTMAFIIVIMDAVFRFHYIYVLAMITALGYVFVRDRSMNGNGKTVEPVHWPAILSIRELDPVDRSTLTALLVQPESDPNMTMKMTELLARLNQSVNKPVASETSPVKEIPVPYPAFVHELSVLLNELDIRCTLSAAVIGRENIRFCCVRISVNRKLDLDQSRALDSLTRSLIGYNGISWVTRPPRKTVIHLAFPGN